MEKIDTSSNCCDDLGIVIEVIKGENPGYSFRPSMKSREKSRSDSEIKKLEATKEEKDDNWVLCPFCEHYSTKHEVIETRRSEGEYYCLYCLEHVFSAEELGVEEEKKEEKEDESLCDTCISRGKCKVLVTPGNKIYQCINYTSNEFEIISIKNSGYTPSRLARFAGGSLILYQGVWLAIYEENVVLDCKVSTEKLPGYTSRKDLVRKIAKRAGRYVANQDAIRVKKSDM
jgi:hypothetical protein